MDSNNNNTDTAVTVPEETFEEQNRRFLALSDAEKRMAIANDVLLQIQLGKYKSRTFGFINIRFSKTAQFNVEDSLRELFPQIEVCDVCALGGLFMSCTRFNNKTKVGAVRDCSWEDRLKVASERPMGQIIREGGSFSNQLDQFFSREQLMLIEMAFEEGEGSFQVVFEMNSYLNEDNQWTRITPEIERAVKFAKNNLCGDFDQRTLRLQKIMENIIANGGTFVP
jgi:hypothetical protein